MIRVISDYWQFVNFALRFENHRFSIAAAVYSNRRTHFVACRLKTSELAYNANALCESDFAVLQFYINILNLEMARVELASEMIPKQPLHS